MRVGEVSTLALPFTLSLAFPLPFALAFSFAFPFPFTFTFALALALARAGALDAALVGGARVVVGAQDRAPKDRHDRTAKAAAMTRTRATDGLDTVAR